ncbi:MAG: O-antigen ligase family protein [Haloechinothrix sp.]
MSQQAAALALGTLALLAMVPAVVALRRARAFGDWDLTATLVFLVGALASLPTVLSALVSGRTVILDPFGNVVVGLSPWALQVDQVSNALLLGAGLLFFAHRVAGGQAWISAAPAIAIVLCLVVAFSDGLNGHGIFAPRQLVLLAVLLAATVARPGRSALLGAATAGLLLALLGGVQAFVHADSVFRECRVDKCGPFGALFTGVFPNENTYGLPLALSVALVWLAFRGPVRIVLAGYLVLVVFATGSRLSEMVAAAALVSLMVLRPSLAEDGPAMDRPRADALAGRNGLALLGVCGAAAVGFVLPLTASSPDTLSDRAYFWRFGLGEIARSPIYGFGAKSWEGLHQTGQVPVAFSYSPHNQWLDLAYAGGIIGVGIFLALIAGILLLGGRASFLAACCVLIPVLVASGLERPWSFGISDWLSFTLVAATLLPVHRRPVSVAEYGQARRAGSPVGAGFRPSPVDSPGRMPGR